MEVKAAGVCKSNWHARQGHDLDIKNLPHIPGHELSGTIAALGEGVTGWELTQNCGSHWEPSSQRN
ncbi:alcohol dehydrogenase catalytic domain-containing protein [bacterium]|nr:alcohol dehydrogenase catalytic domain-containing protein [bacterium]MDA7886856.1 alcohol dehydrogenase catalytic domain-containing protein [bacterium]MDB4422771.1 alcohol dehydrogenase catalytic domain-containing protein [bacterium]MDB4423535.1 alcohol dehydrogenase catalytic domain-containing protein [bacterium]MDB4466255.1 alcohol dehydrogenase catalytic domain-containing protein [bacterium]